MSETCVGVAVATEAGECLDLYRSCDVTDDIAGCDWHAEMMSERRRVEILVGRRSCETRKILPQP